MFRKKHLPIPLPPPRLLISVVVWKVRNSGVKFGGGEGGGVIGPPGVIPPGIIPPGIIPPGIPPKGPPGNPGIDGPCGKPPGDPIGENPRPRRLVSN